MAHDKEMEMSEYDDRSASKQSPPAAKDDVHADHLAGRHGKYDPACDHCRLEAEKEYQRKLASGELNRIEFLD
jgi:hypothetical protein